MFPVSQLPDDVSGRKLVGIFSQAQEGRLAQRVKTAGGRLSAQQWQALAAIAQRFTPGTPLHLTTRQAIELHDIAPEVICDVQQAVAEAGLSCVGACGDTYRNITICPCSGVRPGSVDLLPLAGMINAHLRRVEGIYHLPRKFKIALSCGPDCGQPWIHDIGLVVSDRDGSQGFDVIVAGSLGARPSTGMSLGWFPAEQGVALIVAAVRVFAEHGDRDNRKKARLRHVRERMGDGPFTKVLMHAFEQVKNKRDWPKLGCQQTDGGYPARAVLNFAHGDVTAAMAEALGQIQSDGAFCVRIGPQHQVIVFGRDDARLGEKLASFHALEAAAAAAATIVACPGDRWCGHGLVDTNRLADRVRAELGGELPVGAAVCISGCPNGCSHTAVADVGLIGGRAMRDGRSEECFTVVVGGDMGRGPRLADPLAKKLSAEQAIAEIRKYLRSGLSTKEDHANVSR